MRHHAQVPQVFKIDKLITDVPPWLCGKGKATRPAANRCRGVNNPYIMPPCTFLMGYAVATYETFYQT